MGLQSNVCKEWTIDFKNFFLNSSLTLVGCTLLIHSYFFTWNIASMNSEIVYNVKTKTWNWKIHLFLDIKISRGKNNSEFQFITTQPLVEFLPTLKVWSLTHKNTTSCLIYYTRPLTNFQTSNFFWGNIFLLVYSVFTYNNLITSWTIMFNGTTFRVSSSGNVHDYVAHIYRNYANLYVSNRTCRRRWEVA